MDFKRASKERTFELLETWRNKHNIWKVIKDGKPKMAPCGDNGGIWRFILKHSISVHTNPLILEKWTKSWMTVHLLNYKISKVKYYVCEIKKAFY